MASFYKGYRDRIIDVVESFGHSVSDTAMPWREDKVTDGHKRDAILANAPMSNYGCFVVPKVIE